MRNRRTQGLQKCNSKLRVVMINKGDKLGDSDIELKVTLIHSNLRQLNNFIFLYSLFKGNKVILRPLKNVSCLIASI